MNRVALALSLVALPACTPSCGGGGGDSGVPPDVFECMQAELDAADPVESELVHLQVNELRYSLAGYNRVAPGSDGAQGAVLSDGSLVIASGSAFLFRLMLDGRVLPVAIVRGSTYFAADDSEVFRVSWGELDAQAFHVERWEYGRMAALDGSFSEPLFGDCLAANGYTPHISAGRYITLRSNCAGSGMTRYVAERWEVRDRLERVRPGVVIQQPQFTSFGSEPSAAPS